MRAPLGRRFGTVLSASLAGLATLSAAGDASAAEYYVAPTGSDSAAGTMAAPWATLQKGVNTAVAGDTVWIRGGTYRVTTPATRRGDRHRRDRRSERHRRHRCRANGNRRRWRDRRHRRRPW